ncbi:hypothetical protein HMPREF9062_1980 [Actinomyces sp. oral taxon 448 str. F0400]|nr:hypothetical protein HMPREF9062_1980 [Actinomyces sp. oral taxon 448 str. F0400]
MALQSGLSAADGEITVTKASHNAFTTMNRVASRRSPPWNGS